MKIYLASKSPRRKALLEQMGVAFEILPVNTPEIHHPDESPKAYSQRITQEKLHAARAKIQAEQLIFLPVLCADTEVVMNGHIMGKPKDEKEAFRMLQSYSGQTHQVLTTVGLLYNDYEDIRTHCTQVTFAEMSQEEILAYLATKDYQDKAGAYGIQSTIAQFISHIDGCFYSVMGLPLNTVRDMLRDLDSVCHSTLPLVVFQKEYD